MKRFLISTSIAALTCGSITPAFAANSADGESTIDRVLDVITVTARKKKDAENVQSVPVAVTAFNADTIEALQVRDIEGLSYSAPNVSLDDIGTSKGVANFSIRGLGINSSIPSIDPTVGVFVDGVYIGLNNGLIQDTFDLSSIEVLRGPQGLLFGRNTTGGAVLINTGNPTAEFEAKVRVAHEAPVDSGRGSGSTFLQAYVSGPLVEDRLNGRLSAYYNKDKGYFKDLVFGDNRGGGETTLIRGSLEFLPSESLRILAKIEHVNVDADGPVSQNRGVYERGTFDFSNDNQGLFDNKSTLASLRADLDVAFGDGTISNIFGYRDFQQQTSGDIDALPAFIFHSDSDLRQEQVSNELRYAGRFGNVDLTTGFFYFKQDIAYTEIRHLPPVTPLSFYGGGAQDHTVWGVFAQADIDVTEKLTATLGLRHSSEEKDANISYTIPRAAACSVVDATCPDDVTDKNDWSNFTPKLGLQYRFSDTLQAYASYTKGFRSGGYNFRITNPVAFLEQVAATGSFAFDEESVDAYELGVKYRSADGGLTLNAAVFHTKVDDMQREVNFASATSGVSQFILNTADTDITGLELEASVRLASNFLVTGNLGLIDAAYQDVRSDISGDGVTDAADLALEIPRVPDVTYGVGFIWDMDMGKAGMLTLRSNIQYKDRFAYSDNNLGWISSATMLDAALAWQTPLENVKLALYGKNLLDESVVGGETQLPFGGPLSTGVAQPFAANPQGGTFSTLKRGRVLGLELIVGF
ncbi:TonB-dependent receptor [Kordiimonas lacus]|uniref:Iron complex outermembrane recepter protein n=1 Tax=Kordiimonas lacus TaxID=637679 RepID=A0A1G7A7J0_9PROT|nr:TonB-dependent receptor [Kordiimonas lacus]SDE10888.1 iron complex outermembrane recepter protein [Kordiimonas lacus]